MKRVFIDCNSCAIMYGGLMIVAYSFDYSNVSKQLSFYSRDSNCFGVLDLNECYLKFQRLSDENVKFYEIVNK